MPSEVIAIDGPAASGKSTAAKKLSERLGIPYINTGNMYRAIAWKALQEGISLDLPSEDKISKLLENLNLDYVKIPEGQYEIQVNGEFPGSAIRSPEVASCVSNVAAMPLVRSWLLEKQRELAKLGLIVMEGRDIGTVIFPDSKYKFFLTASPEVRARRRLAQDGETFDNATVESVAREIAERDHKDMNRETAPLKQADDAVFVDCSDMNIEETLLFLLSKVKEKQK
jgi:cytidylate kinase